MRDLGEFAFANCREVRYNQESAVVKKYIVYNTS